MRNKKDLLYFCSPRPPYGLKSLKKYKNKSFLKFLKPNNYDSLEALPTKIAQKFHSFKIICIETSTMFLLYLDLDKSINLEEDTPKLKFLTAIFFLYEFP